MSAYILLVGYIGCSQSFGQSEDDSGALSITSKTALCSAGFYIKEFQGKNDEKEEDNRARKSLGIEETVSLTLAGKPKGKIEKLTWSFESGRDLVNPIADTELKGKPSLKITVKPDLTPKQLENNSKIKIKVKTSEGRTVRMDEPFQVFFPDGIKGMHVGMGTPMEDTQNNSWITSPSMTLILTLQPESVNFSNIYIIERDFGSNPQNGMSLNEGHKNNGVDVLQDINLCNSTPPDAIRGGFVHNTIKDEKTNPEGEHELPQKWSWKCSFQVHKGEGGPKSEAYDVGQIGEIGNQNLDFSRTIQGVTPKLKNTGQPEYIVVFYGKVLKFGCSVTRVSTDSEGVLTYEGPKEDEE